MTIYLNLSAPEHAHLIVNYHEVFAEHNNYRLDWVCEAMPRPGDSLDPLFIQGLLSGLTDLNMLPGIWQVMDVKWNKLPESIVPVLSVVGK